MWTAEVVLLCALNMLGRSQASFPPIALVTAMPANASAGAEGYVRQDDPHIYLVTTGGNFRAAQEAMNRCGNTNAVRKIASVLIHEEAHLRQGADEKTAYEAQLTTLSALGAGVGSPAYQEVIKGMQRTLHLQRRTRAPAGLIASVVP